MLPLLKQSSLAGAAEYRTQAALLERSPHAVDVLIDVLTDRGFRCGSVCVRVSTSVCVWVCWFLRCRGSRGECGGHVVAL